MTAAPWDRLGSASASQIAATVALGLLGFFASLAVTAAVLVRLPADYFVVDERPLPLAGRPRVVRLGARVGLNLLGLLLVAIGVVLSLPGVPGQGVLTILLGIMLVDVPGKRRLERAIVRRASVHAAINRIRARFDRPPIVVPGA